MKAANMFQMISRVVRTGFIALMLSFAALASITMSAPANAQAPQFRSASTIEGAGTLNFPAGSVSTDWLVMFVISTSAVTTPAGWTATVSYPWNVYGYQSYVFTRQKGSATSVAISPPNGGAMILAYQNVAGIGAVGTMAESTHAAGTVVMNSITPQSPYSTVMGMISDRGGYTLTPPSGFTTRLNFNTYYFGQNFADKAYGSTAPTGTSSWTQDATYPGIGILIELLPSFSPPAIAAAFSPSGILSGNTSTLSFTLSNANSSALTNANFTSTLTNMSVASTTIGGTCSATTNSPSLTVGATALNLTVPSVPAGGCTVTLQITSTTPGTHPTSTSGITTTQTPAAGAPSNTASLTVSSTPYPPAMTTAFNPAWIAAGTNSTLTFNLTSPNSIALTNAQFTATLTNMTVANAAMAGNCGGVTSSPALAIGASSINITIPTLPAGGCTVTVQVTSTTIGSNAVSTSGATATEMSGAGNATSAYLTVNPVDVGFYYVHADHLGTPRAITRPSDNQVMWKWDNSDPFGANLANNDPTSCGITFKYNLRFPGQYFDEETGTHYNYYRTYDPATGRYIQSDPIGLSGGINTYVYVNGSPLFGADPDGLIIDGGGCSPEKWALLLQGEARLRKELEKPCENCKESDKSCVPCELKAKLLASLASRIVSCASQNARTQDGRDVCAQADVPGRRIWIRPIGFGSTCNCPASLLLHEMQHNFGSRHPKNQQDPDPIIMRDKKCLKNLCGSP